MGDLIMASVIKEVTRKARKKHSCCECAGDIIKGECYQVTNRIWDGEPVTYKTCASCVELRDDYHNSTGEMVSFGFLREAISNCFYKEYGAKEFAVDYPDVAPNIKKLFKLGKADSKKGTN